MFEVHQHRFRTNRPTFDETFSASKQVFPRHPSALYDATKLIKRFDLDLSYALASQVEIRGNLLKCTDFSTPQAVATLKNPTLLLGQMFDPFTHTPLPELQSMAPF